MGNLKITRNLRIMTFLSILGIFISLWGCASRKDQRDALTGNEFRRLLTLQKEKQNAAKANEEALKKSPEMTAEGFERLADAYFQQGNLEMAFLQYDRALRLNPNKPGIRHKQGRLFLEKGMTEEARKW